MNREERIADAFLKSLGFVSVIHEPDGNIPPDFALDGRIGVEVRRLNQHFFSANNEAQGLEEARIPLFKLLQSTLRAFDSQYEGVSYLVSIRFHRPIGEGSLNERAISKALTGFLDSPSQLPSTIKVTESISFHINSSQPVGGRVFLFAGGTDREGGGFILPEFIKNFDHCVKEKAGKIGAHYHKYASWWLVLVDQIAYGFDDSERQQIISRVCLNPCWDKVIVLDSSNGRKTLEI